MSGPAYCAVYDFELMPYALGDVLTWNVQTAIRCEELGRERVDILICLDERYPAGIYQRGLVTAENCGLFFNELFGAFGTHPRPGNILVYRRREDVLNHLGGIARQDPAAAEMLADYERALAARDDEDALVGYFTKYIHSHERINAFAKAHRRIPLLLPSTGTEPDIRGLLTRRFADKRVVAIHMRMRRLDAGYGGERTYARDSDFLEWYEFLKSAEQAHPDVQFVALGRLQEKPLELLKLPNVTSVRVFGLGLGHELTLTVHSDLFIGTSSGFAAMANFSTVPYFVTHMTAASCKAYEIEHGAQRLPFATERQWLIYEPETRELLMQLLERGLADIPPRTGTGPKLDPAIDVPSWEGERSHWLQRDATTHRFFCSDDYTDKETAFLLWPHIRSTQAAFNHLKGEVSGLTLQRMEVSFGRLCQRFPEYLRLRREIARYRKDEKTARQCEERLYALSVHDDHGLFFKLRRYVNRTYPIRQWIRWAWTRRRRIPRRLGRLLRGRLAI